MFIFLLFDRDELPWLDGCLRMVTALTPLMPLILLMTATLSYPMLMLLDIHHERILVQLCAFLHKRELTSPLWQSVRARRVAIMRR